MKYYFFAIFMGVISFPVFASNVIPFNDSKAKNIKALSQYKIAGYLQGSGLGLAKAADLNNYPGPKHVLELASEMKLTSSQLEETNVIYRQMKREAIKVGKKILQKEWELEQKFSSGSVDPATLKVLLSDIGALKSTIRFIHLNAHIAQKEILTKHQVHVYNQLRGYDRPASAAHKHAVSLR